LRAYQSWNTVKDTQSEIFQMPKIALQKVVVVVVDAEAAFKAAVLT